MIYLIITTSINTKYDIVNEEHRKQLYLNSIRTTLSYIKNIGIKPIVVENNGNRSTYLDSLDCDVFYTNNNSNIYQHKGVNELKDIKDVIHAYNILDDDMIIKLTGRYCPLNKSFFEIVKTNVKYHAFVKFFNVCKKIYTDDDCVLGLFAIRCKYLKTFQYECLSSPEVEFARFIRNSIHRQKINEVQELFLRCCFAGKLRMLDV